MKRLVTSLLVIGFLGILCAEQAMAIPAFARKYRMSCTTCHNPFPRLKPYGDDFAGNGFVLEDQESPRYYVDTGDMGLSLLREFPVAMRIESYAIVDETNDKNMDFRTPYKVKFLTGGSLSDHVSYYLYFYFDERGEVEGLDDAFIMFNNMLGQDLDIYVGQFALSDPMLKSELRLTYEDYVPYKQTVGGSSIRLSYDRGLMFTWGLPTNTGTGLTAMIVNGNGIGSANPDHSFDSDANKVFAGHLSQDIGDIAGLGLFGLFGSEENSAAVANDVNIMGANLGVGLGPVDLSGQYLMRTDTDPTFTGSPPDDVITNGMIAEAVYWPHGDQSTWFLTALYNQITSDEMPAMDYQSVTGHFGYLVRTNVRLGVEGTYDMENESTVFGLGLNAAF